MLITEPSAMCRNTLSYLFVMQNGRKLRTTLLAKRKLFVKQNARKLRTALLAKRKDFQENPRSQQQPFLALRVSKTFLARSLTVVFALGFIDAGYSGDWSRIGVISKESEDLLKVAAFLVVPLCIFLIFSSPKKIED